MKKRLLISLLSFTLCLTPLTTLAAETSAPESLNDNSIHAETVLETAIPDETVSLELPEAVLSNSLAETETFAPIYSNKGVHDYIVR